MSGDAPRDAAERFRDALGCSIGLHFDDSKLGTLSDLLERRTRARGIDVGTYLQSLAEPQRRDELRTLAQELTVGETFFFRNMAQLDAFMEVALPDRVQARPAAAELQVLCAGCATGEEPYSLAILLRERGLHIGRGVRIRAADIHAAHLAKAERGRYAPWALRETPLELRRRWFREEGREFEIDPEVRKSVSFCEANLASDDPELWRAERYDVVFCRNVLMYFTPAQAQTLIARISRALAPGGYLFLGHAETLRGVSDRYHLQHSHETFYYRLKEGLGAEPPLSTPSGSAFDASRSPPMDPQVGWMGAIERAAVRIRTLAARGPSTASELAPAPARRERADLGRALELLKSERFGAALEALDCDAASGADPDRLVLRAALLTHRGNLDEAERCCMELLALDELSAAAHYLLGLCRTGSSQPGAAIHHHEVAAYLDPGFAMPHVQLGLLLRRAGDSARAVRELQHALVLLRREDVSRLLLFGGGFGRDALIALCRAELESAGGRP
jgi:chemotaxis protein methyltransferase CheR